MQHTVRNALINVVQNLCCVIPLFQLCRLKSSLQCCLHNKSTA